MSPVNHEYLLFWHFFQRIEKELSYERWIDKYKIFQRYLIEQSCQKTMEWEEFKQLCRILFLQEARDLKKFDAILEESIKKEQETWNSWIWNTTYSPGLSEELSGSNLKGDQQDSRRILDSISDGRSGKKEKSPKTHKNQQNKKQDWYFNPELEKVFDREKFGKTSNRVDLDSSMYLHMDEYLPYTRRQMVKAWQRLRRREKIGFSDILDIPAAINQIAKTGLLLEPPMQRAVGNRPNTLLIYADARGSMTPFVELSSRLIQTAQNEGGHKKAGVFYFQNAPLNEVFLNANLTQGIGIKESLLLANQQFTVAVIISDAGAARGNQNIESIYTRFALTQAFLKLLQERTHKILWLNPLPAHRWEGTCAEKIVNAGNLVTMMVPIYESDALDPQELIKKLIRY